MTSAPVPSPSSGRLDGVVGTDWYATHVAARLGEFSHESAPWHRRLWDAGTLAALHEVSEASRWRAQGVLSESAVVWLSRELERVAGPDPGVGDARVHRLLNERLHTGVPYGTRQWRQLHELLPLVEDGYIPRWRSAVDHQSQQPGAERLSRAVAAHLLDRGYSMKALHGWVRHHREESSRLGDLLDDATTMADRGDVEFEVLLPFTAMPRPGEAALHGNWLDAGAVSRWLKARGGRDPAARSGQPHGAFTYRVPAKDPWAAAAVAAGVLERLESRATFVPGYGRLRALGVAWVHDPGRVVTGPVRELDLRRAHRGVYVRSLGAERKLHEVGLTSTALDDALSLAAGLNTGSPGPALVSGWSALEALLFSSADPADPRDGRVVASRRAAALAACSWVRAELSSLSHHHAAPPSADGGTWPVGPRAMALDAAHGPPTTSSAAAMSEHLDACENNRTRCREVLIAYAAGQRLSLSEPEDAASQERMLGLVGDAATTLGEVRKQVEHTFRRMYRTRNIVAHGAGASSQGLEVALRTAAPLAGVVLDRVVHARLVTGLAPLHLADRAENNLALIGSSAARGLESLLE